MATLIQLPEDCSCSTASWLRLRSTRDCKQLSGLKVLSPPRYSGCVARECHWHCLGMRDRKNMPSHGHMQGLVARPLPLGEMARVVAQLGCDRGLYQHEPLRLGVQSVPVVGGVTRRKQQRPGIAKNDKATAQSKPQTNQPCHTQTASEQHYQPVHQTSDAPHTSASTPPGRRCQCPCGYSYVVIHTCKALSQAAPVRCMFHAT